MCKIETSNQSYYDKIILDGQAHLIGCNSIQIRNSQSKPRNMRSIHISRLFSKYAPEAKEISDTELNRLFSFIVEKKPFLITGAGLSTGFFLSIYF